MTTELEVVYDVLWTKTPLTKNGSASYKDLRENFTMKYHAGLLFIEIYWTVLISSYLLLDDRIRLITERNIVGLNVAGLKQKGRCD